jgi:Rod binding domain-containing protein
MVDVALPPVPVDTTHQSSVPSIAGVKTRQQAEAVAEQFERMFVSEMLKPMFEGIKTDGPFGGGNAEDTFRPMLLDQYADGVAKAGGVGIKDAVLKEILRMQGLE